MTVHNSTPFILSEKQIAYFWSRTALNPQTGCLEWTGYKSKRGGYGYVTYNRRTIKAHRLAYMLHYNDDPKGLHVLHSCPHGDNSACLSKAHLRKGTNYENVQDRIARGHTAHGKRNGHHTKPEKTLRGEQCGQAKLLLLQVLEIRARYAMGQRNYAALGRLFGITKSYARFIVKRVNWKHI